MRNAAPTLSSQAGASLIEVLVAVGILGALAVIGSQQVTQSLKFRKLLFDRAAVVGLADSSSASVAYAVRDVVQDALDHDAPSVKLALITAGAKLATAPAGLPAGIKLLGRLTPLALPGGQVKNAAAYQATGARCRGNAGLAASPSLSDRSLYLCLQYTQSDFSAPGLWTGVDPAFPVLTELVIRAFDPTTGQTVALDAIPLAGAPVQLKVFYSVVWVAQDGDKERRAVRWLAKEQYVSLR